MQNRYSPWFYVFLIGFGAWLYRFGEQLSTAALYTLCAIVFCGLTITAYRGITPEFVSGVGFSAKIMLIVVITLIVVLMDFFGPPPGKSEFILQGVILCAAAYFIWRKHG